MKGTRREFLGQSARMIATGIVGSTVVSNLANGAEPTPPATQPAPTKPPVALRTLGRTDLNVSVVSLGTANASEPVVRYAVEHGVNFIHIADDYMGGKSLVEVSKGIKGKRDKLLLGLKTTWKWMDPRADVILDRDLRKLGTDHVDVIFFHFHNTPEMVGDPRVKEAFDRWKKAGKVRYMGLTTHGGMKACMEAAIKTGWYDCLMPIYNLSMRYEYKSIFNACEKNKIGFIAMKTMSRRIFGEHFGYVPAMLRDSAVTTICKTLPSLAAVKKIIDAAKAPVSDRDAERMVELAARMDFGRCRMCGTCTGVCPNGLAVNDLVRSVDYYVDTMGEYDMGKEVFDGIDRSRSAGVCRDCGQCERACPNRVPIRHFIRRAGDMFA